MQKSSIMKSFYIFRPRSFPLVHLMPGSLRSLSLDVSAPVLTVSPLEAVVSEGWARKCCAPKLKPSMANRTAEGSRGIGT